MALIHAAVLSPTKRELIAAWLPSQSWASGVRGDPEVLGSFRFDDPDGEVGIETHLVRYGADVLQVPVTYRAAPLPDGEAALVGTTQHSALGTRWVYDGCHDAAFIRMAAVSTLTGVGQAAEVRVSADQELTWPPSVRLSFSGSVPARVRVDGWQGQPSDDRWMVWRNSAAELRVARRPAPYEQEGTLPRSGLAVMTGVVDGLPGPLVLATASLDPD